MKAIIELGGSLLIPQVCGSERFRIQLSMRIS